MGEARFRAHTQGVWRPDPDPEGPVIAAYQALLDGASLTMAARAYGISSAHIQEHCASLPGSHVHLRGRCVFCGAVRQVHGDAGELQEV